VLALLPRNYWDWAEGEPEMPFSEQQILQIYEWYQNLENRMGDIFSVLPMTTEVYLRSTDTPRAVPIIVEAASIVDSILRTLFPPRAIRANGRTVTRQRATIHDFYRELNDGLRLTGSRSIVLAPIPFVLSPFAGWTAAPPHQLRWWTAYNRLKHDRLHWTSESNLLVALECLCALQQLMLRIPTLLSMSFRFGWIDCSGWNPEVVLEGLPNMINRTLRSFLSYTRLFCTPLANPEWDTIDAIRPGTYQNRMKLANFLGKLI
jgi:hypothetical protein